MCESQTTPSVRRPGPLLEVTDPLALACLWVILQLLCCAAGCRAGVILCALQLLLELLHWRNGTINSSIETDLSSLRSSIVRIMRRPEGEEAHVCRCLDALGRLAQRLPQLRNLRRACDNLCECQLCSASCCHSAS